MSEHDYPWRNEKLLREKYVEEEKSSREIAEEWNTGKTTILRWLGRYEIDKRPDHRPAKNSDQPWRDESKLREKYLEKQMTIDEIANEWDTDNSVIRRWLKKHEVETRALVDYKLQSAPSITMHEFGYEQVRSQFRGETDRILIHRLLAVAIGKLSPEQLGDQTIHIHHRNGIPWDNRPENIEVLSHSEHSSLHAKMQLENDSNNFGKERASKGK